MCDGDCNAKCAHVRVHIHYVELPDNLTRVEWRCRDCGTLFSPSAAQQVAEADRAGRLEEYRILLLAMARRDPQLDPVWMEQYAKEKLAAIGPAA